MLIHVTNLLGFCPVSNKQFTLSSNSQYRFVLKCLYMLTQRLTVTFSSSLQVLDKAFRVPFQQDVDYLAKLNQQIDVVANGGIEFYNYLAIVQSSGYGKTRAVLE